MNLESLRLHLKNLGISKGRYSLDGGVPNEKLCLEVSEDGTWHIYYSERGGKTTMSYWREEAAACQEFLKLLLGE